MPSPSIYKSEILFFFSNSRCSIGILYEFFEDSDRNCRWHIRKIHQCLYWYKFLSGFTYLTWQVVYGGTEKGDCLFMYWVVDAEVQMTWIKYDFPLSSSIDYELTDACLCPGMQKIVAGKNKIFNPKLRHQGAICWLRKELFWYNGLAHTFILFLEKKLFYMLR